MPPSIRRRTRDRTPARGHCICPRPPRAPPKDIPGTVLVDVDENTKTPTPLGCTITPCHAGPQKEKKGDRVDIGPQRPLSPPKPDPPRCPWIAVCSCCRGSSRWYRYSLAADKSVVVVGRSTCGDLMWVGRAVPTSQACRMVQTRAATWCSSFGLSAVEIHAAGGRQAGVGPPTQPISVAWGSGQRPAEKRPNNFFLSRCSLAHDGHSVSRPPACAHP